MPELSVTDEQLRRLEAVREDLEAAFVGPYGTVRPEDAIEYLLDGYSPPGEADADAEAAGSAGPAADGAAPADGEGDGSDSTAGNGGAAEGGDGNADVADGNGASGDGAGADAAGGSPEDTLQQAMNLLEAHDDRWREGSGDEPYEVDLPDGSTEAVRTKDDIKRLLFKHWK